MTAIESYLDELHSHLWMSASARQAVLSEIREHVQELEVSRGSEFQTVSEIHQVFGQTRSLAADLNRSVSWREARAPWWLFMVAPLTCVILFAILKLFSQAFFPLSSTVFFGNIIRAILGLIIHGFAYLPMIAVLIIGMKRGIRPGLIMAAGVTPNVCFLLLSTLFFIPHPSILLNHTFLSNLLTSYGTSILTGFQIAALVVLADVAKANRLGMNVVLCILTLLGCDVLRIGLSSLTQRETTTTWNLCLELLAMTLVTIGIAYVSQIKARESRARVS
jgi:hypothetical protein